MSDEPSCYYRGHAAHRKQLRSDPAQKRAQRCLDTSDALRRAGDIINGEKDIVYEGIDSHISPAALGSDTKFRQVP